MSHDKWMDNEDVVHLYSRTLPAIKMNEIELFVEIWMILESVTQSEISQKEKNIYCTLIHLCGM